MRQIIQGKLYNTKTAQQLYFWSNNRDPQDLRYRAKTLYKTGKANLFIHHAGGPMTDVAPADRSQVEKGGQRIEPIEEGTAVRFLAAHNQFEIIQEHFPDYYQEA